MFFWLLVLFLCFLLFTAYGYLVAFTMPAPDLGIAIVIISVISFELVTGVSLPRYSIEPGPRYFCRIFRKVFSVLILLTLKRRYTPQDKSKPLKRSTPPPMSKDFSSSFKDFRISAQVFC